MSEVKVLMVPTIEGNVPMKAVISAFAKWLAVNYSDGILRLFKVEATGNLVPVKQTWEEAVDFAFRVSNFNGLATVSELGLPLSDRVERVSLVKGQKLAAIPAKGKGVLSITYTENYMLLGFEKGKFQIWRLETNPEMVYEGTSYGSSVVSLKAAKDGCIYMIDESGRALLWTGHKQVQGVLINPETGEPMYPFKAETLAVHPVEPVAAFSSGQQKALEQKIARSLGQSFDSETGEFGGGQVCVAGLGQVWIIQSHRTFAQFLKFTPEGGLLIGSPSGFEAWSTNPDDNRSLEMHFRAFWSPSSVKANNLLALQPVGDAVYAAVN